MSRTDVPGVIEPGRLYVVREARERLRLGPATWRKLLAGGLRVVREGRQAYVFADDLLRILRDRAEGLPCRDDLGKARGQGAQG